MNNLTLIQAHRCRVADGVLAFALIVVGIVFLTLFLVRNWQ